ncbi:MAG: hypothetical protein OEZ58_01240 [Gammaproteobacteria bacterium]|nr:hypothetical protein [Gammaproteobacteria bacterium]MDH5727601.1 hypothetical protein [Gammaproteobacteria bacterium]
MIDSKECPFPIAPHIRWIAQDSDGVWWGYTVEPLRHEHGWYENEVGEYERLGVNAEENWQNSLKRVK